MSEQVKVRYAKVTVSVSRDVLVVLPENCTDLQAREIVKNYDLNEITDGQDPDVWIQSVEIGTVDPEDSDLYVIQRKEMAPAGDVEWLEEIEKYAVKTEEPHPEG